MAITLDGTTGTTTPALTNSALTSGRVTYAGTSGVLQDSANLVFTGSNLGIGIASPTTPLYIQATAQCINTFETTNAANDAGLLMKNGTRSWSLFNNGGDGRLRFYDNTASADRMTLDSSGRLLVNTTSSILTSAITQIVGNSTYTNALAVKANDLETSIVTTNTSGTGTYKGVTFCNNGNSFTGVGNISVAAAAVAYNTTSDYRLKENVQPMTNALARVALLKPCTYTWKLNGEAAEGFIAHELAEVCPQAVTGDKDAVDAEGKINPQGVDTSFLIATLTAAIQELTARVAALEAK
jgi:hypothetical protein